MHGNIEFSDVFVGGADGINTYRIPALLVSPKGDLLAFCEARRHSRRDDEPKDIMLKRSTDGGRSWSAAQMAVPGPGTDGINNPCPMIAGDAIHLFCINREKDGPRRHRQLMAQSHDDGRTWSDAQDIGQRFKNHNPSFVPGPGVSLRMRNGRWVVPGNVRVPAESAGITDPGQELVSFACAAYSDDRGATWHIGERVGQSWSNESQVVELANGALMINFRIQALNDAQCRGLAISDDGGATWRETFLARELHDPVCQGGFIRCDLPELAPCADPLLCTHLDVKQRGGANRRNLTAHLSLDGGRSWPTARVLHAGPAAYSCPAILPDGAIGVLYECGDQDRYERLRFARFDPAWLMQKT